MKLTRNEDGTFTFEREQGWIALTANEVSFLVNQSNKIGLRDSIKYLCDELDGDTIDLNKAPYGIEDFMEEIFTDLEYDVDYGDLPTESYIKEKIQDTANFYEMNLD